MNRREFVASTAAAIVGGSAAGVNATPLPSSVRINLAGNASAKPFPFSVMLWTVEPKLPFEQRIGKVSEAGYHAVELVEEYKDWGKDDFATARKQFHQLGIVVDACSGIHASLCDPAQRDAFLAEIRAKLPVLAELECSRLILLTGNLVPGLSREKMHANCVEALKLAADLVAPQKVELLLENIDPEENPKYFLTSVAEGFQVIREVGNPHVRFLYDFFHEQIAEGNLISKLEKNLDLTGLVHIADVPGRHEPGTGEINYAAIFRKLGQLGYPRYVAMEFIPTGDVVTSLRAAREFAEKYANEGRARAASLAAAEEDTYASS
ncbi:MAG: TIM barrel protein [Candidatus Acidiferrum sp.]